MSKLPELIDFMEGELPEAEEVELELLLRHSVTDRRAFLNMTKLREGIKLLDPITIEEKEIIMNPEYNKKLTGKIMAQIKRASRSTKVLKKDNLLKLQMGSVS